MLWDSLESPQRHIFMEKFVKLSLNYHQIPSLSFSLLSFTFQFDAEFRRFSVDRAKVGKFNDFNEILAKLHQLQSIPFVITYTDNHGDLLPINNDDNFGLALSTANPVLKILVQKKGRHICYK